MTPTSLTFSDPAVSWEALEGVARFVGLIRSASNFWVADLLATAERLYGEQYAQLEQALGISHQTLLNIVSIGNKIPKERRLDGLTFSTHAEVAALAPAEQKRWLRTAAKQGLTSAELRSEIHTERKRNGEVHPVDVQRCEACGRPL